jgi:DNA-binding response OmpR family regulator
MRILIIEDEVKLAQAMKRALEIQKYAVDIVHDGEIGLDRAVGEKPDLLILDVMLPTKDGIEVCKELRAQGIYIPILMLTAKGLTTDKVTGLDIGADDYMVKPFSFEELFARLRALLRRPSDSSDPILKLADLTLDPKSLIVKRGDKSITLSAKEFSLLEYLLRHPNTVLNKEQLVQHVWDYDADVLPTTVEVHIKHLRDKIDTPFKSPLIHTVRGFGYKLAER